MNVLIQNHITLLNNYYLSIYYLVSNLYELSTQNVNILMILLIDILYILYEYLLIYLMLLHYVNLLTYTQILDRHLYYFMLLLFSIILLYYYDLFVLIFIFNDMYAVHLWNVGMHRIFFSVRKFFYSAYLILSIHAHMLLNLSFSVLYISLIYVLIYNYYFVVFDPSNRLFELLELLVFCV
jgi:hypothetical protein